MTTPPVRLWHRRLFRKYVVICVVLVFAALLTSGALQVFFTAVETRDTLASLQREKAAGAAIRIEQFVGETQRQISGTILPGALAGTLTTEQRRADFLRLLRQAPAVTEVSYIDTAGREQLRVSRLAMNLVGSGDDRSATAGFSQARNGRQYFGPVYFRNESEPYMTIAVGEGGTDGGVISAEVNLKFIWDVVSQIRFGKAGYAYVVDGSGQLVAHPDISLVLKRTDLSAIPQVAESLASGALPGRSGAGTLDAHDLSGQPVLAAFQRIEPLRWSVFVEQPLGDALEPLYDSVLRTVLLLLAGLVLAVAASLILARRMVTPIEMLRDGATRIGAGALDQRIDVKTGDELEALADEFNAMAEQLQQSYAGLERKVEQRTHDLEIALEQERATATENARLAAEIEESNRQLAAASRHKSEFLANMSHELRTPLNAIIGFSEVLLERMFGDLNERQEEYTQDIHSSGRHLLSLINDILDLSKVEAGRMDLEAGAFSLAEVLEHGLTIVRERAVNHGIALGLDVDPAIGAVQADERKVKQVVFNLLSNAIKFTPDGGQVTITARRITDDVEVSVRDTGIGIAPEDQALVFEEFRQARQSSTQKHEGTGLGLALCRRFVELHGGRIWVESEPGVGSTFTFTLPGAALSPELADLRPETEASVDGEYHRLDPSTIGGPGT